jgi:hypothetical protein
MEMNEIIKVYVYNGMTRPELGLINGKCYISHGDRKPTFFNPREIKIGNEWRPWCSFTEKLIFRDELKSLNRDSNLSSLLGEVKY